MELIFEPDEAVYDPGRDIVRFLALEGAHFVRCAVSGEALKEAAGARQATDEEMLRFYRQHRRRIQALAGRKHAARKLEIDGMILIDIGDLRR
jgi:hypothetical protein